MLMPNTSMNNQVITNIEKTSTVEYCFNIIETICTKLIEKKFRQIDKASPLLMHADPQERIDIYKTIFSPQELQAIISDYQFILKDIQKQDVKLEYEFSVVGLKNTENILKEFKRINFLQEKTNYFLEKALDKQINALKLSNIANIIVDKLEIGNLILEKLEVNSINGQEFIQVINKSLKGVLLNCLKDFKEQLKEQTLELVYDNELQTQPRTINHERESIA